MFRDCNFNKSAFALCFTEFFTCFSLFGILSIIILFFVYTMHLPQKLSYELLGNFVALSFIASQAGGFIAGRYLSFQTTCLIGLITYSVGYLLLIHYTDMRFIYVGLTLVACGAGLFEPNVRSLLGMHYKNATNQQRSSGFIILHTFNIAGQLFGPIVLTYLRADNPHYIFLCAGIFVVIGSIFFSLNHQRIKQLESSYWNENKKKCTWKGVLSVLALIFLAFFILQRHDVKYIFELFFLGVALLFFVTLPRVSHDIRIRVTSIFFILFGVSIAEICFRQCFGIIDLFTKVYVNRVVMGTNIHTGLFESVEPFFVFIVFAFVIKIRKYLHDSGHPLSAGTSISFGLLMLSICFGLLVAGVYFSGNSKIPVVWLLLCYFFMGIGELLTIPIATAAVANWSPDNWRGAMMGVLFLMTGVSSYISAEIGKFISPHKGNPVLETYGHLFTILTIFAAVMSLAFYFAWGFWQKRYAVELGEKR